MKKKTNRQITQICGQITGDIAKANQTGYKFSGIYIVKSMTKNVKFNTIYRDEDTFTYHLFLKDPTIFQLVQAKNILRERMRFDFQKILDGLSGIIQDLSIPYTYNESINVL